MSFATVTSCAANVGQILLTVPACPTRRPALKVCLPPSGIGRVQAKGTQRRCLVVCSTGKGFGAGQGPDKKLENSRAMQIEGSELLAKLMEAKDVRAAARENVDKLNENFFIVTSTYLEMARKEGNQDVVSRIEPILRITMQEKEKTLRPEIQLLNALLRAPSEQERQKIYVEDKNRQWFVNPKDSYFFKLVDMMMKDVEQSKGNPKRMFILKQLQEIQKETLLIAQSMESK
eukprot:jgi/Mesvir1/3913/Mv19856-RA.1